LPVLIVLSVLIPTGPVSGQYREYYFFGQVLDIYKNPIAGVDITLRDVATSRSYSVKTNARGEFKFAGLPHGVYTVVFKKEGYAKKEDEWRFETPQENLQKVEIPPVTLVSEEQVQEAQRLKEMQGLVKEAADKIGQKDFDGALVLLKDTLAKDPNDINALYLLGLCYSRKKMVPEAIDALTRVIQASPKFPPAHFELAVGYQQQGDIAKALEFYGKTLELDPNNADAAYNSGLILFGQNRMEEALAFFEKALALRPDEPAYLEMAGRCYINQANFEKAIDCLEKAKARYTDQERITFLDDLISKLKEQIKKEARPRPETGT
jgi:tetratricopeptide (TPR) repeat protein